MKILFGRTAKTFVTSGNRFIICLLNNYSFIIGWCYSHRLCFLMCYSIMMISSDLYSFRFKWMSCFNIMISSILSSACSLAKIMPTNFTYLMILINRFIICFLIYNCVRFLTCYSVMMYRFCYSIMMYCFCNWNIIVMLMFISFRWRWIVTTVWTACVISRWFWCTTVCCWFRNTCTWWAVDCSFIWYRRYTCYSIILWYFSTWFLCDNCFLIPIFISYYFSYSNFSFSNFRSLYDIDF